LPDFAIDWTNDSMIPKFFKNKEVLLNTTHNYVNKAINALVPIFLIPYYNKMFGVEQFGFLIYIQAIASLMIYISDYGFIVTGTREVSVNADNPLHLSSLISSVMVVKLLLTLGIFGGLFAVSTATNMPPAKLWLYVLTFLSLTFQNYMPGWFFQGMKKNFIITVSNIASKLLMLALVIFFVTPGSALWIVPLVEGISYFLFFLVGITLAFTSFNIKFEVPSLKALAHNFALSKDNFLITLFSWITTSGILIFTERFVTPTAFGYYGIFTRICYYIFIGVHQINLSIFPYMSEHFAKSREEGIALFKSVARLYIFCVFMLLAGGLLLGRYFFSMFFDATFVADLDEYIPVFYWLVGRIALLLANSYLGLQFFVANKCDRIYRDYYVVNMVVSFLACIVLAQWLGILGSAIAVFLGELVMFLLMLRKYFTMTSPSATGAL
jgi:PST family polysaccharide transporter